MHKGHSFKTFHKLGNASKKFTQNLVLEGPLQFYVRSFAHIMPRWKAYVNLCHFWHIPSYIADAGFERTTRHSVEGHAAKWQRQRTHHCQLLRNPLCTPPSRFESVQNIVFLPNRVTVPNPYGIVLWSSEWSFGDPRDRTIPWMWFCNPSLIRCKNTTKLYELSIALT